MVEGKGFEGGRRLRVSEEEDSWLVLSTVVFGSFWDAHASKVGIENCGFDCKSKLYHRGTARSCNN